MNTDRIVWHDDDKARKVEMIVDYVTEAGHLRVAGIRPIAVTFFNAQTKTVERTIGVHTETGRRILRRQYLASCDGQATLEDTIRKQREMRDELAIAV